MGFTQCLEQRIPGLHDHEPPQSKVMPMGVMNRNAAFQQILEDQLAPAQDWADPFVDDIITASRDPDMS